VSVTTLTKAVMARLVRAIHDFLPRQNSKTWMARMKRAMTERSRGFVQLSRGQA